MRKIIAENPDIIDIRMLLKPGMEMMKESVRTKVRLFKSSGKAW
jgi:fructose/tagatose bisphosphate aldolase